MPSNHAETSADRPGPAIFLEIGGPSEETPRQVPVRVLNFAAGVATLEAERSNNDVDWQNLSHRLLNLSLALPETEETLTIRGRLLWSRYSKQAGRGLSLGLAVGHPAARVRKALESQIIHTPKDTKELWDRFDRQLAESPARSGLFEHGTYLLGLGLLVEGMSLKLLGLNSLNFIALTSMLLGFMAIGGKALGALWQLRHKSR
jgi:hypothetical protein